MSDSAAIFMAGSTGYLGSHLSIAQAGEARIPFDAPRQDAAGELNGKLNSGGEDDN